MPILFSVVETCGDSAADISAKTVASEERTRAIADAGDNLMVQLDSDFIFFAEFSHQAGDFRVGLRTFPIEIPASDSLLAGRDGNPFTGVCDPTWLDGHFVVIAPLAPGTYNLSTSSVVTLPEHLGAEPRQMDTVYRLTVTD